ncbi:MAG: DUF2085 domain-containing protein [Actinobacteria bacterium]|nr:MAG: DUF2085 domain-containing protein [Actinomycetota bacterium]
MPEGYLKTFLRIVVTHWLLIVNLPVFLLVSLAILTPFLNYHNLAAGKILFAFYGLSCHQLPARSFFILGKQIAFCSRDLALYSSIIVGSALWKITNRKISLLAWILLILPMLLDVLLNASGLKQGSNEVRVITGAVAGLATSFYILPHIKKAMLKAKEEVAKM